MRGVLVILVALAPLAGCGFPSSQGQGRYELIDVLVANRNIPKDFKIDETMVRFEKIPKNHVQPKALHKTDELLGQIAGSTIFQGAQITATMLLSIEDAGLAFKIPKGYRGLTLPLDPAVPIGDLRPGNYVDVLHVRPAATGNGSEVVTVLQNVYVLAVGDDLGQARPVNVPSEDGSPPKVHRRHAKTVTLMLSPDEVQKIALAQDTGGVRLSVRSLWEGNTQVPLDKHKSPHPLGTPFPGGP